MKPSQVWDAIVELVPWLFPLQSTTVCKHCRFHQYIETDQGKTFLTSNHHPLCKIKDTEPIQITHLTGTLNTPVPCDRCTESPGFTYFGATKSKCPWCNGTGAKP